MHDFYASLASIVNSGQSNSIIVYGNIYDLFWNGISHVPLVPFLLQKTQPAECIQLVYELNGPIRIGKDYQFIKAAWIRWRQKISGNASQPLLQQIKDICKGKGNPDDFDEHLQIAIGNSTFALEFLRQLCFCSRAEMGGKNLLIFIEAADLITPAGNGDVSSLNDTQLRRISIIQDWFCDPEFLNGKDTVCLLAESRSLIHSRISRLPQIIGVEVPSPNKEERMHFIQQYCNPIGPLAWSEVERLRIAKMTAGLSIHALRQLMAQAIYTKQPLDTGVICKAVEQYIQSMVGDDVVEFQRPHHKLDAVMGATKLIKFIKSELLPRIKAEPSKALSGCAVAGPIGGGKTFIFEAVAAELDMPVVVLKGLRSPWYGQTDVISERLRRVLEALDQVVVFVDEADVQFGGVGSDVHETERRLTGKIQQIMSDPRLRGKVFWLLMTARIQLLSADMRRPGRADLIIPVLDPEGEDRMAFIQWSLSSIGNKIKEELIEIVKRVHNLLPASYSAAAFSSLKSYLEVVFSGKEVTFAALQAAIEELLPPAIETTRRYQTLQAVLNCTRKSLMPIEFLHRNKSDIEEEIRQMEARGIK